MAYNDAMAGIFSSGRAVEVLTALDQSGGASLAELARNLDVSPSVAQKALGVLASSDLVESLRESRRRVRHSISVPASDLDGLLNVASASIPADRHLFVAFRANPGVAFAGHDALGWMVVLGRAATPANGVAVNRAIRRSPGTAVTRLTRDQIADQLLEGDTASSDRARAMTVCSGNFDRVFADPRRHADPSAPALGALHQSLRQPSRRAIAEVARAYGLSRVVVFGSAVHADFRPDSDIDVLVRHRPGVPRSLASESDLQDRLEALFDRDVDLIEERAADPAITQKANHEGVALYG
jgi:predicted nucleotidyltransferase/DNA-binding transcriptional ArsR family regulator